MKSKVAAKKWLDGRLMENFLVITGGRFMRVFEATQVYSDNLFMNFQIKTK